MKEHLATPQTEHPELAAAIGVPRLFLKREDLHPYGSHKGRSIPAMIDVKAARGARDFVVSSSGNAALAAIRHIQKRNAEGADLSLRVFVGEHINPEKKQRLIDEVRDTRIEISESKRPLQALLEAVKGERRESLRQSTDDEALVGYADLAAELSAIPELSDVFVGTSSGTTAQAIAAYFKDKGMPVAVHIVQTAEHSPLAEDLGGMKPEPETSIADAIVDKVAHRRSSLVPLLRDTGGSGWIVTNAEIRKAREAMVKDAAVEASPNGALAIAGLMKARRAGKVFKGTVVCVVTGK